MLLGAEHGLIDMCPVLRVSKCYVRRNPDSQVIVDVKLRTLMIEATYLGAVEADTVFHKPTHIIVYHKDGQEIPYKNILRRYILVYEIVFRVRNMYVMFFSSN